MRHWMCYLPLMLSIAIAGCVDAYRDPGQGAHVATVTFRKGYDAHFPQGGNQAFGISERDDCSESKFITDLGPFSGDSKSAKVTASHPVVIFAYATIFQGASSPTGVALERYTCKSRFRFSPEDGHAYDIVQRASMDGTCEIAVSDSGTGVPLTTMPIGDGPACTNPDVWK